MAHLFSFCSKTMQLLKRMDHFTQDVNLFRALLNNLGTINADN